MPSFKPHQPNRLPTLVGCLSRSSDWDSNKCLVLNSDKTEAMITAPLEIHLRFSHVIDFFCSSSKTSVRNLGVVFDSSLNFDLHIKCTSLSFYFLLRNIFKIRASFFELEQIVRLCHCTCCNALLPV